MEGCNGLLLLSVWLCVLICNVNSIAIYAANSFNGPYEDISKTLESLRSEKLRLEMLLSYGYVQPLQKKYIERDIYYMEQRISQFEKNSRVAYRDYLDMMKKMKDNFEQEKVLKNQLEEEKKDLQKQLEKANHSYREAIDRIAAVQKKHEQDNGIYMEKVGALTKEVQRAAKEYAEYREQQVQQEDITSAKYKKLLEEKEGVEQKLKEEKYQSQKDTETLLNKLKEAQNRHSWALEAISINSKSDNKPVPIPYQDEINEIRHNMHMLINTDNSDVLVPSVTKENLEVLLQKLYAEGKLSESLPPNELQIILDDVEKSTMDIRETQIKQRKRLQRKTEHNDSENNEEELVSLKKANEAVEVSNEFLQDLARRKAYLKAIMQVGEMLEKVR